MTQTTNEESVTLEKYLDMRLESLANLMSARFEAAQRAVDLAADKLDVKLEAMNAWQQTLLDRNQEYAKQEQVTRIQAWIDRSGGRWQALTVGSVLLSIITMALTLVKLTVR